MEANLIVTALDEKEWQGCLQRLDYHTQRARVCGRKIYSHAAIFFSNVPESLSKRDMRPEISRPGVYGSREIVFESLQQPKPDGKLGFSTLNDRGGWYAQWRDPVVYFYKIDPEKIDPRTLFLVCERFANSGLTYDWGWAIQAAYCPFLPLAACKCNCNTRSQPTTNCVGAVAICLAAAMDPAALADRNRAREILKLARPHPELYFPSELLAELHEARLIPAAPWRRLVLRSGALGDQSAGSYAPLPALVMNR